MVASEPGPSGARTNDIFCGVGFVEVECGREKRVFSEGLVNVFEKDVEDVEIVAACRQRITENLERSGRDLQLQENPGCHFMAV